MVDIGATVRATVTRIEPYGLYADVDGQPMLVLIPEVAWESRYPLQDWYQVGQEIKAQVLHYNYKDRQIVGSIRRLYPETNPFRELSRMEPGTEIQGLIKHVSGSDVSVQFPNGAYGSFPIKEASKDLKSGDTVLATIGALEVDDGRLVLHFVRKLNDIANGTAAALPAKELAGGLNP